MSKDLDQATKTTEMLYSIKDTMSDCKIICSERIPSISVEFKTIEKSLSNILGYIDNYTNDLMREVDFVKVPVNIEKKPNLRVVK